MGSVASPLWVVDPDTVIQPTWLLGATELLVTNQPVALASATVPSVKGSKLRCHSYLSQSQHQLLSGKSMLYYLEE